MAIRYSLRILGGLHIEQDGRPVQGLRSRKALALLCYLVARGEAISRSVLSTLFWPDLPETAALRNLSWAMAHVSGIFPGCLVADRQTVRFSLGEATWVDLIAFNEAIRSDDPVQLAQAVALWRGDLMEGFYINDCPDFEVWLLHEREHLLQRLIETYEQLIQHERRRGNYRTALGYATRLVQLDPCREETHRSLMMLLALDGQRTAALTQYEACRLTLLEELGVEPSEATSALYAQIRDGGQPAEQSDLVAAPLLQPSIWQHLPSPFTSFVGRERECGQLASLLTDQSVRLITLVGPGGMGKTRLAVHLAEQQRDAFRDGVYVIPLASIPSPEALIFAVAEALQLVPSGRVEIKAQLIEYLRTRELLLVLDNFEHLLDGALLLLELLYQAPRMTLLVTSRERLHLQPEHLIALGGLDLPVQDDIATIERSHAVRLFVERARRSDFGFAFSPAVAADIAAICRMVEGCPLGIELAATWVSRLSCREIVVSMSQSSDCLSTQMRDLPERHRSLRAVFDHSWRLLNEEQRRAYCALAIFHGGFDAEAAHAVAGVGLTQLGALQDKSLLQATTAGRYDFHQLLRQYAQERLDEQPDEAEALRQRHAAYFVSLAGMAAPALRGPQQELWLARLGHEHANLLGVLELASQREDALTMLQLGQALWRFWEFKAYLREGRLWLERGLRLAESCEEASAQALRLEHGRSRQQTQHDASAQSLRPLMAECQLALGSLLRIVGLYDEALAHLTLAHATFKQLGQRSQQAITAGSIGRLHINLGSFASAQTYLQEQLALATELDDQAERSNALNYLGIYASEVGNYAEALERWEEVLQLATQSLDYYLMSKLTNNIATHYEIQGDYPRAFEFWARSLQLSLQHGFHLSTCLCIGNLAEIYLSYGLYSQSLACAHYSLALARQLSNESVVAWILGLIAEIAGHQQDDQQADELFLKAISLQRTVRSPFYLARVLYQYAAFLRRRGHFADALIYARQAYNVTCQHGLKAPVGELDARLQLLQLELLLGEITPDAAEVLLQQLRAAWGDAEEQAQISYMLWKVCGRASDRQDASDRFATLHLKRPRASYRQRYLELTGQPLAEPSIPDLIHFCPAEFQSAGLCDPMPI